MYKAKERSFEAYPVQDMYTRYIEGSNKERREIYVQGYNQGVLDVLESIEEVITRYNCPEYGNFCDHLYDVIDKIKS